MPKQTIPAGLCQCGCGERTNIAKATSPRTGHVKGQPYRYIAGHHCRVQMEPPNASGLCQCGCGQLAPIATVTNVAGGRLKGHPLRFVNGHNGRLRRTSPAPAVVAAHRALWAEAGVEYGLCLCGCGGTAPLASRTSTRSSLVAGEPMRYIGKHYIRLSPVEFVIENRGYVTPCHIWQLSCDERGYGRTSRGGCAMRAHVAYWTDRHGPVPTGLELDHLCCQPPCVNADHLEAVPHVENVRRGARAKLTMADARAIRRSSNDPAQLAAIYGVHPVTIGHVLTGRTWKEPEAV